MKSLFVFSGYCQKYIICTVFYFRLCTLYFTLNNCLRSSTVFGIKKKIYTVYFSNVLFSFRFAFKNRLG